MVLVASLSALVRGNKEGEGRKTVTKGQGEKIDERTGTVFSVSSLFSLFLAAERQSGKKEDSSSLALIVMTLNVRDKSNSFCCPTYT